MFCIEGQRLCLLVLVCCQRSRQVYSSVSIAVGLLISLRDSGFWLTLLQLQLPPAAIRPLHFMQGFELTSCNSANSVIPWVPRVWPRNTHFLSRYRHSNFDSGRDSNSPIGSCRVAPQRGLEQAFGRTLPAIHRNRRYRPEESKSHWHAPVEPLFCP